MIKPEEVREHAAAVAGWYAREGTAQPNSLAMRLARDEVPALCAEFVAVNQARREALAELAALRQQLDEVRGERDRAQEQAAELLEDALDHGGRSDLKAAEADNARLLDVYRAAEAALVDAQAAVNAVFNQEIGIGPQVGAREGWYKAACWVSECGWSTTGSGPVVEDEGHQHIATHRDLVGLAEDAIELLRIPLRAAVDSYRSAAPAEPAPGR